jgi:hypothetical protein
LNRDEKINDERVVRKESGGNTKLYTLEATGLMKEESEVNEENTKVGMLNYSVADHSERPLNLIFTSVVDHC